MLSKLLVVSFRNIPYKNIENLARSAQSLIRQYNNYINKYGDIDSKNPTFTKNLTNPTQIPNEVISPTDNKYKLHDNNKNIFCYA